MKRLLMLILFLSFIPQGYAMVNMRNASYNEKWVDYIDPRAGIEIKIERFYSSRSLFDGIFGYGWCSQLETHLTITSDGIINLTECGGGLEVTYYPNNFDKINKEHTIDMIIANFKKTRKMTVTDIANLKSELKKNTKMRFESAQKLGLVDITKIKKTGNTFFSRSKGYESITYDGKKYVRKLFSGVTEWYSKDGKLIRITEPTGQHLEIKYKGQKIASLIDDQKRILYFTIPRDLGKVTKISNGSGLNVNYKYLGDNLMEVTNMWSKTYKYKYDQAHNMTGVDFPDGTKIEMAYDTTKDWIKRYTNRQGCTEKFDFDSEPDNKVNHYWGTFERSCKNSSERLKGKHEFWYKPYANAPGKYLDRVLEDYDSQSKDVNFHPHFGRPSTITETNKNSYFRGFSFYDNGFVNNRQDISYKGTSKRKETITDWTKAKFDYDRKTYKIEKLELKELNKKGIETKTRSIRVAYNEFGLLSKATEKSKKFIQIDYDKFGKVEKLSNQNGDVVKLTHKTGVEKPVEIEYEKIGKVKITYDDEGNVASVDTEGKRNIATSIIEKFLEMVNFLGPLGEEMEI